jgi:hypothetical protein
MEIRDMTTETMAATIADMTTMATRAIKEITIAKAKKNSMARLHKPRHFFVALKENPDAATVRMSRSSETSFS